MPQNQNDKKVASAPPDVGPSTDSNQLGIWAPHLSEQQLELCQAYTRELLRFNKSLNLISAGTVARVDAAHILDVVRAWEIIEKQIPAGALVQDFGSGNGLPGLLCAALAPDRKFQIIDRDQRKMEFCKHIVAALGLSNVTVSCMDVNDLAPGSVRYALSRGFASVAKSLLMLRSVFAVGGQFFMMKGESWSLELSEMPPRLFGVWKCEMIGQYKLPDTPSEFVVLKCAKVAE